MRVADKRVQFDFEVDEQELAVTIVKDLRLLMVGAVRILNKTIIEERHRGAARGAQGASSERRPAAERLIDLSHTIEHGLITYPGLPAPIVCDFLGRERSRAMYAEGTEFHIGKIEMVANTGTYLDSPFHRFAGGADVSELELDRLADLEGVLVRVTGMTGRAIDRALFAPYDVRDRAVLVHTGWAAHWGTDRYADGHPYLTEDAAAYLVESGAALVGIDSLNIDDTTGGHRPVHTTLLAAGVPIVEHMRGLEQLPATGFRFSAVPAKVKGMGTWPVRAHAILDG